MKQGATQGGKIAVILLAAGQSRRMQGRDKLLEPVGDTNMISCAVKAATDSQASAVFVAVPPNAKTRRAALKVFGVTLITADDFSEGMGGSLRNAMAHIGPEFDAVIIALADMPEITPAHFDALIAAYDPAQNHEICRAVTSDGHAGHPVLFGHRFFSALSQSCGDAGAKSVIQANLPAVQNVPTKGHGARLDLDTPEAWAAWRQKPKP